MKFCTATPELLVQTQQSISAKFFNTYAINWDFQSFVTLMGLSLLSNIRTYIKQLTEVWRHFTSDVSRA